MPLGGGGEFLLSIGSWGSATGWRLHGWIDFNGFAFSTQLLVSRDLKMGRLAVKKLLPYYQQWLSCWSIIGPMIDLNGAWIDFNGFAFSTQLLVSRDLKMGRLAVKKLLPYYQQWLSCWSIIGPMIDLNGACVLKDQRRMPPKKVYPNTLPRPQVSKFTFKRKRGNDTYRTDIG